MYKVEQKAENIYEGIANMMAGAKDDYIQMSTRKRKKELQDQIDNFPHGVRSVYVNGRRVKREDVEIERSYLEISSSSYDISDIPDHINYLPRKQAAEYIGISESTLTRYHLKGKLKWIARRNRTPIYKRETLDAFKEKNRGKLLS